MVMMVMMMMLLAAKEEDTSKEHTFLGKSGWTPRRDLTWAMSDMLSNLL